MTPFGPKAEKLIATALSVMLLSIVGMTVDEIVKYGIAFIDLMPRETPWQGPFGTGVMLGFLGWTEFGALIRVSRSIRVQVQCLAVWSFLLACMFAVRFRPFGPKLVLPFTVAICALALYSLVAVFRPRDLF